MGKVFNDVERLKTKYIKLWWDTESKNLLKKTYSIKEKIIKESQLDSCINKILSVIENTPNEEKQRKIWQNDLIDLIKKEAKNILAIKNKGLERIVIDEFMDAAISFTESVKEFDANLEAIDIMQAMRNVWIMNLIQAISNIEIESTPSIFAYSMLYPYTDNYLDDSSISDNDKKEFNKNLKKRLEGKDINSNNSYEEKIYKLISMIENQYDRNIYPEVFESLVCIHSGQCKSLMQQITQNSPYESDILAISAEKGGTSVLADAYLVCGKLDDELIDLVFGLGFVLQLIDDLQDVKEDLKNNSMTVFSQTSRSYKLDSLTNKLINFTLNALDFESYCISPHIVEIKELILNNSLLMIFEAISNNRKLFSKSYVSSIEDFSSIGFDYFVKTNKKIKKKAKKINFTI